MYHPQRIWAGGGYTIDSIIPNISDSISTSGFLKSKNKSLVILTLHLASEPSVIPNPGEMLFYDDQLNWVWLPYFLFNTLKTDGTSFMQGIFDGITASQADVNNNNFVFQLKSRISNSAVIFKLPTIGALTFYQNDLTNPVNDYTTARCFTMNGCDVVSRTGTPQLSEPYELTWFDSTQVNDWRSLSEYSNQMNTEHDEFNMQKSAFNSNIQNEVDVANYIYSTTTFELEPTRRLYIQAKNTFILSSLIYSTNLQYLSTISSQSIANYHAYMSSIDNYSTVSSVEQSTQSSLTSEYIHHSTIVANALPPYSNALSTFSVCTLRYVAISTTISTLSSISTIFYNNPTIDDNTISSMQFFKIHDESVVIPFDQSYKISTFIEYKKDLYRNKIPAEVSAASTYSSFLTMDLLMLSSISALRASTIDISGRLLSAQSSLTGWTIENGSTMIGYSTVSTLYSIDVAISTYYHDSSVEISTLSTYTVAKNNLTALNGIHDAMIRGQGAEQLLGSLTGLYSYLNRSQVNLNDINLAISTQTYLVDSAFDAYELAMNTRGNSETEIQNKISNASTIKANLCQKTIDDETKNISTNIELALRSARRMSSLSTMIGVCTPSIILSSFIWAKYYSTLSIPILYKEDINRQIYSKRQEILGLESQVIIERMIKGNLSSQIESKMETISSLQFQLNDIRNNHKQLSTQYKDLRIAISTIASNFGQSPSQPPAPQIQSGGGRSTIADYYTDLAKAITHFSTYSNAFNVSTLNYMNYELDSYTNVLQEISSVVNLDLSQKLSESYTRNISTPYVDNHLIIRSKIDSLSTLLSVEKSLKQQYIQYKNEYDIQMYYKLTSQTEVSSLSQADFFNLKLGLDAAIYNCNYYINTRKNFYRDLSTYIVNLSTAQIMSYDNYIGLAQEKNVRDGISTYIIPARIPLKMAFSTINSRADYFSTGGYIQPPVSTCTDSSIYSSVTVIDRSPFTVATTTIPVAAGMPVRSLRITSPNNAFEIMQIIVVDSNGKNRAFSKGVSLSPTSFANAINGTITAGSVTNTIAARIITNGTSYSTELQRRLGGSAALLTFSTPASSEARTITINLGAEYDITGITYIKKPNSAYNTTGLTITCLNASGTTVYTNTLSANRDTTTLDLRLIDGSPHLTSIAAVRGFYPINKGVCGYNARYVRLYPPTPFPSQFTFNLSQIAVTTYNRENIALGSGVLLQYFTDVPTNGTNSGITTDDNGASFKSVLLNGIYKARPIGQSIRKSALSANSYLELDLGSEQDVTSVQLFNSVGGTNFMNMLVVILTEDFLPIQRNKVSANVNKEILDFRYSGGDSNCSIALKWPSYYGEAGIKARYIEIKRSTVLEFSYITVINKLGLNVAYGKQVTIGSGITPRNAYSAVQDTLDQTRAVYLTGTNCTLTIDLGQLTEVCGLNVIGAANYATQLCSPGAIITLRDNNRTAVTSFTVSSDKNTSWDLRYDPDDANQAQFEWEERLWVRKQVRFGTYAQKILVQTTSANINNVRANIKITDSTGREVPLTSITATSFSLYGLTFAAFDLGRSWEINTVSVKSLIPSTNLIILQDCNGYIVGLDYPISTQPAPNAAYRFADFRKNKTVGAVYPFPIVVGPHGSGINARYIEVLPRDNQTPLYISQIIAVNACGRNIAIEADTYASNPAAGSKASSAVDGMYEDELNEQNQFSLMYQKYLAKDPSISFQSAGGAGDKWMVDLGRFIQINPDDSTNLCSNQVSNSACQTKDNIQYGYDHEINCIIFVAPIGRQAECQDVIVNLYNDEGVMVGSSRITAMITVFNVDFLDFRQDVTIPLNEALVEPVQRITRTNAATVSPPTGLMIQYVRIEQIPLRLLGPNATLKPIQISKLIVLDNDGNDIARYKPTKSFSSANSELDLSYRAVDNIYIPKPRAKAYISEAGPGQYLEVNLGCEMGVVAVEIIPIIDKDPVALNQLRFKMYNANHDVIVIQQMTTSMQQGRVSLANTNMKNIPAAGVNIKDTFFSRAYESGLITSPPSTPGDPPQINPLPTLATTNSAAVNVNFTYPWAPTTSAQIGTLANYVRIMNLNSYIQISQLMVFNQNGENVLNNVSSNSVFATNALPGFPPERAIDGVGGFFHVARPETECYISERKKYEYWQVNLGSTTNVIGIKYIPPNMNIARNTGTRIQLLDSTQNVIAESILETPGILEYYVDFRKPPITGIPLSAFCMPRISDTGLTWLTTPSAPTGIAENPTTGDIYITDFLQHVIYRSVYNAVTDTFATPTKFFGTTGTAGATLTTLNSPVGIVFYSDSLYVADSANNRILKISNLTAATGTATNTGLIVTNPYGLAVGINSTALTTTSTVPTYRLYVSQNANPGSIISWVFGSAVTTQTQPISGLGSPQGMALSNMSGILYLYVACADDASVRAFNVITNQEDIAQKIGVGGVKTLGFPFMRPTDVKIDPNTNNIFITDYLKNILYYASQTTQSVKPIAGTGEGGLSQDTTKPATMSMLLYPYAGTYHSKTGDFLLSDQGNALVRRLNLSSKKLTLTYTNNRASSKWNTTTLAAGSDPSKPIDKNMPPPTIDTETIRILNTNATLQSAQDNYAGLFIISDTNTVNTLTGLSGFAGTISAIYNDTVNDVYYVATLNGTISSVYKYTYAAPGSAIKLFDIQKTTHGLSITSLCTYNNTGLCFAYGNTIKQWSPTDTTPITIAGKDASTSTTAQLQDQYATYVTLGRVQSLIYDSTNNLIYFTDFIQHMVYKLDMDTGILYPVTGGSSAIRMNTRSVDTPINASTIRLFSPHGIIMGGDNNIFISASNQIIQLAPAYNSQGIPYFLASPYVGFSAIAGKADDGSIAKWAALSAPTNIVMGQDNVLFICDSGNNRICKILPSTYTVYSKGTTGAMRYSPIQLIGNASIEGNVSNLSDNKDFISTQFYTTDIVSDDNGNLYFCNITGDIYQVDVNNNISYFVKVPIVQSSTNTSNICIFNNLDMYVTTGDNKLYRVKLSTKVVTPITITFGTINSICAHQYGYIFFAEGRIILYINVSAPTSKKNLITLPLNINVICVDNASNLYAACNNGTIYKIELNISSTTITPTSSIIAGTGSGAVTGDGVTVALATTLGTITGMCFSLSENCLYISSAGPLNNRIRRLDLDTMTIASYMGQMKQGYPINGAIPTTTTLMSPADVCTDSQGTLYVVDTVGINTSVMIKMPFYLFLKPDVVYPIAGTGIRGFAGDGSYGQSSYLNNPYSARYDAYGNIFIADTGNNCIRMMNATTELITTIAGIPPNAGFSGDGGNATAAQLNGPHDLIVSKSGIIYIADTGNYRIRRLKKTIDGYSIITVAGRGTKATALPANGLQGNTVSIGGIESMDIADNDTLYFLDGDLNTIFKLDTLYKITMVYTGLLNPMSIVLSYNNRQLYVAEQIAISIIDVNTLVKTAYLTNLSSPLGLTIDNAGNLFFINTGTFEIKCYPDKNLKIAETISDTITIMGNGSADFSDDVTPVAGVHDNMQAVNAQITAAMGLDIDRITGKLLISDTDANCIRCIPTSNMSNPCGINANAIRIDSAGFGIKYNITSINIYQNSNRGPSLITLTPNPFISGPLITQTYSFDRILNIQYINIKGDSSLIGAKVYLFNDEDIVSSRVLGRDVLNNNGESVIYASPWTRTCGTIPNAKVLELSCGVPAVTSIILEIPEAFQIYETGKTGYSLTEAQRFISTNQLTFATPNNLKRAYAYKGYWSTPGFISTTDARDPFDLERLDSTGPITIEGSIGYPTVFGYKSDIISTISTISRISTTSTLNRISTNISVAPFNTTRSTMGLYNIFNRAIVVTRAADGTIGNTPHTLGGSQTNKSKVILTFTATELIGIFLQRTYNSTDIDIASVNIKLINGTTKIAEKQITSSSNLIREFIDFRQTNTNTTCASLDTIYNQIITADRARYVRIFSAMTAMPLRIEKISVVSADTGDNVAVGKFCIDNTGTAYIPGTTQTTGLTWIEIDLGDTYPIELVIITPPAGCNIEYTVKAYTQQRATIPIPSQNIASMLTKYIRIQGSGLATLQIDALTAAGRNVGCVSTVTANLITTTTASVIASAQNGTFAIANIFPGASSSYVSESTGEDAYAEITLNTETRLSNIVYTNRTLSINSSYGMRLLQYNAQRQLIQQNYMMGDFRTETFQNTIGNYTIIPVTPRKGFPNVRYVRYENPASKLIQISQLIVEDITGTNVALNKTVTSLSGNAANTANGSYKSLLSNFYRSSAISTVTSTSTAPRTVTATSPTQYVEIDLGSNCTVDKVIYYNAATGQENATNALITLYDSTQRLIGSQKLKGFCPREVIDFKNESTNGYVLQARYLSIENPGTILSNSAASLIYNINDTVTGQATLQIGAVTILDIYERDISKGKFIKITANRWEIDLGMEYPIAQITIVPTSTKLTYYKHMPITFYDTDRNIVKQLYMSNITAVFNPIRVDLSVAPSQYISGEANNTVVSYDALQTIPGSKVRYINITGTGTDPLSLCQLVAIDKNGLNVALGKSTIASSSDTGFDPYNAINGLCNKVYKSNPLELQFWEVDLGAEYFLTQIHIYCGKNIKSCTWYPSSRGAGTKKTYSPASWSGANVWKLSNAIFPLFVLPRFNLGERARFVRIRRAGPLIFSQIAVIDSLGRNVALDLSGVAYPSKSSLSTGSGTDGIYTSGKNMVVNMAGEFQRTSPFVQIGDITASRLITNAWFELDLQNEYWITDIIFYSGHDTYSSGVSVTLRDNYQNIVFGPTPLKNSSVGNNIMIDTDLVPATTAICPLGTTKINNKCYAECDEPIDQSKMDDTKCYSECPEGSKPNTDPAYPEICNKCPEGTTFVDLPFGTNAQQCITSCPEGSEYTPDYTECEIRCNKDSNGMQMGIIDGVCSTLNPYTRGESVPTFFAHNGQLTGGQAYYDINDSAALNNVIYYRGKIPIKEIINGKIIFSGSYQFPGTITNRIIKTNVGTKKTTPSPNPISPNIPVNRPTYTKPTVPLYSVAGDQDSTNYYNVPNTMSYYANDLKYNNIYARSTRNPEYYVGRSSAEIINLTNSVTTITYPLVIPAASAYNCPTGFVQFTDAAGIRKCKTNCRYFSKTEETINGVTKCYDDCPTGVDLSDKSKCLNVCDPGYELTPDNNKCITPCPANTGYSDDTICISCPNTPDPLQNPYMLDKDGDYYNETCYYSRYQVEIDKYIAEGGWQKSNSGALRTAGSEFPSVYFPPSWGGTMKLLGSAGISVWNRAYDWATWMVTGGSVNTNIFNQRLMFGNGTAKIQPSFTEMHYNQIGWEKGYIPGCTDNTTMQCITANPVGTVKAIRAPEPAPPHSALTTHITNMLDRSNWFHSFSRTAMDFNWITIAYKAWVLEGLTPPLTIEGLRRYSAPLINGNINLQAWSNGTLGDIENMIFNRAAFKTEGNYVVWGNRSAEKVFIDNNVTRPIFTTASTVTNRKSIQLTKPVRGTSIPFNIQLPSL